MVDVIGAAELLGHESDAEMLAVRLAHAQRLGNMGWAEWHLHTGETIWSDQVYVIFGRDPGEGPIALPDLAEHVEPGDVATLDRLMWSVVQSVEPVQAEFRIRRGPGSADLRDLRVVLEPLTGPEGTIGMHGVIQDITGRRRAERMVSESRRQLLEARERAAEDRHVMLALREAILPEPDGCLDLPRTRIAVRYVPAEKTANLGGDWFEAAPAPDGRQLLAIGDVSGHGLPAISRMAQLRHALVGLAMTGQAANRLLDWLNELVLHQLKDTTATAIIGHFDPRTRVFAWGQAGNLSPILVRDGVASQLPQPRGVLLGAASGSPYELATTRLQPGDLLLMFTDGLVERRTRDIDVGLDLAMSAARKLEGHDLDGGLDRLLADIGGPNPEDDACLLAVGVLGGPD
ncbi:Serine phosphatase RsbU, regulator of sigma subunit [[Actinomadura] parvosata subsp. kistnae]|uniref:Serine/threonine protein phosphatase n=1 Tax=[Actinomadura] parvosata subsp. kistnae TaxID=1909395 RepID=A0A1V0A1J2_9ACTN|nr:SpoIIE family protein phosphatase [Nonomuraea sp. ATCC 55076]AQZ64070.1 serine/threonine protein phosphatase [Nonomuraea sp. ATCC 55076]SPL89963.1 Serine phosphatase RsbU, regulator of sigma subunit [Actinomadura parvosata subsp. kistnae]